MAARDHLPWNDIAVMFKDCKDYFIALTQILLSPALCNKIY